MARIYEGHLVSEGLKFGVVVGRFNEFISSKLLGGALDAFKRHGAAEEDVEIAWVPGAFEIPFLAERMASSGRYVAVICLGAVIRGETSHDRYINEAVSQGITQAALQTGIPILFGVLTCDTLEQALQRAGGTVGNKGSEAALAALEMVDLISKLPR